MENASKALIMAGGILIAILLISALLLMINQVGDYQTAQSTITKNSQLAKFNMDFERYLDDKGISGADIVTLANKIVDYNQKEGTVNEAANSVDYSIKMSLTISNMEAFTSQYAYDNVRDAIFQKNSYTIGIKDSTFNNENSFQKALTTYSTGVTDKDLMKKLSSVYNKNDNDNERKIKEILMRINPNQYEDWSFSSGETPTETAIKNYKEYTEFKTSTFKVDPDNDTVYENGQIKELYFKWDN